MDDHFDAEGTSLPMFPRPITLLAGATASLLRAQSTRVRLHACARVGEQTVALGRVICHGKGAIRIGNRVLLDGRYAPIELLAHKGGEIVIEDDVVLLGGVTVDAAAHVGVGSGVHIGRLCRLMDSHFHGVGRRDDAPAPVPLQVGSGAWLGDGVILASGAQIGDRTIVHSGAVVTRPFGPDLEIRGLPAAVIRTRTS